MDGMCGWLLVEVDARIAPPLGRREMPERWSKKNLMRVKSWAWMG